MIYYNIARTLPYRNSYWHHHGTFLNIHMAVRPSDGDDEARVRYVIKNLFTERQHYKKMCIYKSLSHFNETLRLNRYEKPLSPLCFCTAH